MISNFYKEIYKLKKLIRRGWQQHNVPGRLESDAEHTFSMLMLGLEIMSKNNLKLDQLKVLKLIAYHELCEIDAGDTTPADNISKEEKTRKEYACIKRLTKEFNMPEIEEYWLEFEQNSTPEAKFVKKLDKFDAVLQSEIYAEEYDIPSLCEDFKSHAPEICDNMEKLNYK